MFGCVQKSTCWGKTVVHDGLSYEFMCVKHCTAQAHEEGGGDCPTAEGIDKIPSERHIGQFIFTSLYLF
jgi:hypothetical protein